MEAIILEAQAAGSDNSPVSSDSSQGALFDSGLRFVHVRKHILCQGWGID